MIIDKQLIYKALISVCALYEYDTVITMVTTCNNMTCFPKSIITIVIDKINQTVL